MRKLSTALLIAGVAVVVALTGCGGGGGSSSSNNNNGNGNTTDTLKVTGRVVDSVTGAGVGNVIIMFGTDQNPATTNPDGSFSIDTKTTSIILAYNGWTGSWPPTFTVSTSNLPQPPPTDTSPLKSIYPVGYSVIYSQYASTVTTDNPNAYYPQGKVPVPSELLSATTTSVSLGTIKVQNGEQMPSPPY